MNYDPYEVVTLTDHGRELAEQVSRRHLALREFLTEVLGLDEQTADANACRMEHAVDDALLSRLVGFAEFVRNCPRAGQDWTDRFKESCQRGEQTVDCGECVAEALSRRPRRQGDSEPA